MKNPAAFIFQQISLFLLLLLSLHANLFAQHQGKTVIGLTAGSSCQTSDLRNDKGGFGLSLTLGKEFPTTAASPLAFELRARLLYARQYGLNPYPSYDISQNNALNGQRGPNYLQYPSSYGISRGFAYLNHRTTVGELGAEGVLTFNRLRQKGLLLSLYGGLGIDWYLTKTDQLNDFSQQAYYAEYADIDPNASQSSIRKTLRNKLDGQYETLADGFSPGGEINLMPSLGIEAGWQITPGFALIAGHRTTFTRDNIIDGQQWADERNDLYHYNYFGLKFSFDQRKKQSPKPRITFIHPATNPATTAYPEYSLEAKIKHVRSAADIRLLLNGHEQPFQFYNETLLSNLHLRPGRNEVSITATNEVGSDHKVAIIVLEGTVIQTPPPPPPPPSQMEKPRVEITIPAKSYVETFDAQANIRAEILHVPYRKDVHLYVNGYEVSQFQYDGRYLNALVNLHPRANSIRIKAFNPAGSDEDKVTIVLKERIQTPPPPAGNPPQVNITKPADNSSTRQPDISFAANTRFVNNRSDIRLFLNGKSLSSFSFDGKQIRAQIRLSKGSNTILVKVVNPFGESQDKVRITYSTPPPAGNPPQVNITKPADNSSTQQPDISFAANTRFVNNRSDIRLFLNGKSLSSFSFDGKQIRAQIRLSKGSNTILVKVVNPFGESQDKVRITYSTPPPATPKPIITFIKPAKKGERTRKTPYALQVKIEHVRGQKDISLKVNNKEIKGFTYDSRSKMLRANITLKAGNNPIEVSAVNEAGRSRANSGVYYEKARPTGGVKPTVEIVSITQPVGNPSHPNIAPSGMTAQTKNVSKKSEISLTLNGQAIDFDFQPETGLVTASFTLERGTSVLKIKVSTRQGQAEDEETISW